MTQVVYTHLKVCQLLCLNGKACTLDMVTVGSDIRYLSGLHQKEMPSSALYLAVRTDKCKVTVKTYLVGFYG